MSSNLGLFEIAGIIWRETYGKDLSVPWADVQPGHAHYSEVLAAASAVRDLIERYDDDDTWR